MSAQRLSASQTIPLLQLLPVFRPIAVLNAFRHHRLFHTCSIDRFLFMGMCSTPFGITDYSTLTFSAASVIASECSTPFGITDYSTAAYHARCSPESRAQRLSASQTIPPGTMDHSRNETVRAQRLSASQTIPQHWHAGQTAVFDVLNAFRHHRLFHGSQRPVHVNG